MDTYQVFGRFDIVVLTKGGDFNETRGIAGKVAGIEGIKSTETLPEAA